MTGGSRSNSSVLTRLHALMEAEAELEQHRGALAAADAALRNMAANASQFKK